MDTISKVNCKPKENETYHYYLHENGGILVVFGVSVSVCLSVPVCPHICGQHNFRSSEWIVMIFDMWVGVWKTKVKVDFGPSGV